MNSDITFTKNLTTTTANCTSVISDISIFSSSNELKILLSSWQSKLFIISVDPSTKTFSETTKFNTIAIDQKNYGISTSVAFLTSNSFIVGTSLGKILRYDNGNPTLLSDISNVITGVAVLVSQGSKPHIIATCSSKDGKKGYFYYNTGDKSTIYTLPAGVKKLSSHQADAAMILTNNSIITFNFMKNVFQQYTTNLPNSLTAITFNSDGSEIAVGDASGLCEVINIQTKESHIFNGTRSQGTQANSYAVTSITHISGKKQYVAASGGGKVNLKPDTQSTSISTPISISHVLSIPNSDSYVSVSSDFMKEPNSKSSLTIEKITF